MRFVLVLAALTLVAPPSVSAEPAAGSRSAGDGWTVQVSVEPSDVGPVVVSVGRVRYAPCSRRCTPAWLQHDLVLANTSDRNVTFGDTRTGALLGSRNHPMLLATDQGCGYADSKPRIEPVCLAYLEVLTLEPRESVTRTITLWKALRGMDALVPGTYVFSKPLRFQVGRHAPEAGDGRTVSLRIVYRIGAW